MIRTFRLESRTLVASDPCYARGSTRHQRVFRSPRLGLWDAALVWSSLGEPGRLVAWNRAALRARPTLLSQLADQPSLRSACAVDSGKLGFFDAVDYRNDASVGDLGRTSGNAWYADTCELVREDAWAVLPRGVVTQVPFDGMCPLQAVRTRSKELVALAAQFVDPEEMDSLVP